MGYYIAKGGHAIIDTWHGFYRIEEGQRLYVVHSDEDGFVVSMAPDSDWKEQFSISRTAMERAKNLTYHLTSNDSMV